jgi:hypothetical protein
MITELDEAKGRIDEAIREVQRSIRDAKARGATTRLLSFEELFGRILGNAKKDPRITNKDQITLNDYAEKVYKKLAKAEGFSEHVVTDASVLRGHVVHLLVKVKDGEILEMTPYADERIAIATFNDWAKAEGLGQTAQDIRIFESKKEAYEKDHPLYLTEYYGSGVKTCPIR